MKSIALRFSESFSPIEGTIKAHEEIINKIGFVWYGKMGNPVGEKVISDIMHEESPKILLIRSGGNKRYWGYVKEIKKEIPSKEEFPSYYHDIADKFKTWFKITQFEFEEAPKDIMSRCIVTSSGSVLSNASKYSMSPYFIIEFNE